MPDEELCDEWLGDVKGSELLTFLRTKLTNTNINWNSFMERSCDSGVIVTTATPATEQGGKIRLADATFAVDLLTDPNGEFVKIVIYRDDEPRVALQDLTN